MPRPHDHPSDDYEDGLGPDPDPTRPPPAAHPLRPLLGCGVLFGVVVLFCGIALSWEKIDKTPDRMHSSNNLKQIAVAIQAYHDTWDELPSNSCDPDGKPLLSWRVHLLPYLEHDSLWKQFKLDEPWDGPHNISLLHLMPRVYLGVTGKAAAPRTYYRGFSSPGAVFDRLLRLDQRRPAAEQLRLTRFADPPSETLLVVEAGVPVEWTRPDDLDAGPGKPFPKMGGLGWRKVFQAAFADGTVRPLKLDTPEDTLRALVTYNGRETLPADWDN